MTDMSVSRVAEVSQEEFGLAQDPELARLQPATGMFTVDTEIRWIPGHSSCRGNAEADRQARQAAS